MAVIKKEAHKDRKSCRTEREGIHFREGCIREIYGDIKDPSRAAGKKKIDTRDCFETDGRIVMYKERKPPEG